MPKNVWLHQWGSFAEAMDFDDAYYLEMSPQERLEPVHFLGEMDFKMSQRDAYAGRKRLRRVFKITQQA